MRDKPHAHFTPLFASIQNLPEHKKIEEVRRKCARKFTAKNGSRKNSGKNCIDLSVYPKMDILLGSFYTQSWDDASSEKVGRSWELKISPSQSRYFSLTHNALEARAYDASKTSIDQPASPFLLLSALLDLLALLSLYFLMPSQLFWSPLHMLLSKKSLLTGCPKN